MTTATRMTASEASRRWDLEPGSTLTESPDAGLINETYVVGGAAGGGDPSAVLQWLNPIFDPRIHLDIVALVAHLEARGLTTPRLIPTSEGDLWVDDDIGCWRLWTFVPGSTIHRLDDARRATAAGDLVGRFHAAMADWRHDFVAPRRSIHNTPVRMADLKAALDGCDGHALAGPAREVGAAILEGWSAWNGSLDLPERPCHGDLKISNLRFAGDPSSSCLLDLDTLGPQTLAAELGDAWRSWCNPAGEDDPELVRFDLDLFAASARAWSKHPLGLTAAERQSLVPGIERICLELSARFCADAVSNHYFREDRSRHPEPGAHNLLRAQSQLRLAGLARDAGPRCRAILDEALRASAADAGDAT